MANNIIGIAHAFDHGSRSMSSDANRTPLLSHHSPSPSYHSSSQRKCRPDLAKIITIASFFVCIFIFAGVIWYMFLQSGGTDPFAHILLPENCTCVEERAQKSCLEKDVFRRDTCVQRDEICSDGLHIPEWLCPQDCSAPCKYDLKVCGQNQCGNGGLCQAIDNDRKCTCAYGFNGENCQHQVDGNVCGDTLSRPGESIMTITSTSSCHCASLCDFVPECHRWEFKPPNQCDLRKSSPEPFEMSTAGHKSGVKSCGGLSANHTGRVLVHTTAEDVCSCKDLCFANYDCFGWTWTEGTCLLRNKGSLTLAGWENGVLSGHRDINCHPIINFEQITEGLTDFPMHDVKEMMGEQCAAMCGLEKPQFQCNSMQNNTFQCDHTYGNQNVGYQYVTSPSGSVSQFCCSCHERFRCHFLECQEENPGRCLTCRANFALAPSLVASFFLVFWIIF